MATVTMTDDKMADLIKLGIEAEFYEKLYKELSAKSDEIIKDVARRAAEQVVSKLVSIHYDSMRGSTIVNVMFGDEK